MLQQLRNQNMSLTNRCHQSRSVVHQCHQVTARLQRRPARCSAASLPQHCYIFDLDSVVDGLQQLTTHWAFTAANDVFQGSTVPGSPDLYQHHMRQLLSVTRHPYEAVLLLRLLADEGIVGSRSVAGREGPVVGRPVRHSGSRPLLIQEIMEFWEDEVQPACLLRWSRQLGITTQQLQESVRQAYLQAQQSTPWQVTDIKQQCYSSSSSSEALAISRNSNTSSTQAAVTSTAAGSSTVAVLPAATCTTQQQQQDTSAAVATALVQPYTAVVQALLCCQQQSIYILSTYPPQVAAAALAAAGLPQPSHSDQAGQRQHHQVLQADDLPRCVELLQQQQQQRRHPDGISINSNDATFILSSPSKAQLLKDSVWNTACCSTSRSSSSNASSHPGQQQQQQTSFLVGDWVCCSPGLRAKALGASDLDLISEVGLAELLGVSDCDAVMDGVAWRS